MNNSVFRFRQFTIDQEGCGMKISTDGILFGSWLMLYNEKHILDVGSGTGLLSLILAQKYPEVNITAIEVEPMAAIKSMANFLNSPWHGRLRAKEINFFDFKPKDEFDHVISNPPYFSTTHIYSSEARSLARNTGSLPLSELAIHSSKILKTGGCLSVIIPSENEEVFLSHARKVGMEHLHRKATVRARSTSRISRVMLTVSRIAAEHVENESIVIHNVDGSYTDTFKKMTGEFYL